jgi:NodT family efflux transporter outer membrane factor (OMF) lipoprotein
MPTRTSRWLGALALTATLFGCTVGPDFVRPTPQTPAQWSQPPAPQSPAPSTASRGAPGAVTSESAQLDAWWTLFGDPLLSSLVERSSRANLDLRAAVLRIEEARAQRDITAAGGWPSLDANAGYSRERLSETTPTGALFTTVGNLKIPGFAGISIPNPYNQYQLAGSASWELDLFGRVRRSVEAAQASVEVSVEDRRAVLVALTADVAQSYIELRGAQSRMAVAEEDVATTRELLELTRQRRSAGLISELDVASATAQLSLTEAQVPAFDQLVTQDINQLSRLLGLAPEALRAELDAVAPIPPVPPSVPIGLPAELARRRPDIREAEAALHAATAQIGVAVAQLFPRLTLTAAGGFQSETVGGLTDWASRFGSLGPTLELPIFDRGRWKTVHLQDIRAQEAAVAYARAVLGALHEVENARAAYGADRERRGWLEIAVAQNRDTLQLARQRYEGGVSTFIDVLDAERVLQQNQLSLIESTSAVSGDLVRLYRALGGGWDHAAPAAP